MRIPGKIAGEAGQWHSAREKKLKARPRKKTTPAWRIARMGVRYTVKRGRKAALKRDGTVRTFRTRDAANRAARELNGA